MNGKIKKRKEITFFFRRAPRDRYEIIQLIGAISRILIYRRKFSPRSNVKIDRLRFCALNNAATERDCIRDFVACENAVFEGSYNIQLPTAG